MRAHLLAAALLVPALAAAEPALNSAGPATAGSMIQVKLSGWPWPTYAPATRYARSGNTFTIDFEYASDFFGPSRPDFWDLPVPLGELPPGNYAVNARLIDLANPNAQPQVISSPLTVGTDPLGVRSLPSEPYASKAFEIIVPSLHYFDPTTVRLSYEGDIVRVDYRYDVNAPVTAGSTPPPGMVAWTSVPVSGLPAGDYWMHAVGSQSNNARTHFYIAYAPMKVRTSVEAVEFYAESTDRYYISANAAEINYLDGLNAGWKRTGQQFQVWSQVAGAPAGVQPVCHFYLPTHGAHYHTALANECQWLRELESQDRAKAASDGSQLTGWTYQGIAFYALVPADGRCAAGTKAVNRGYDGPFRRYAADTNVYGSMVFTYRQEGTVFCTPR